MFTVKFLKKCGLVGWDFIAGYMGAHVLLNLLNKLGGKIRCKALLSILSIFPTSLINSIIQEHECNSLFISDTKIAFVRDFHIKTLNFAIRKCNIFMDVYP